MMVILYPNPRILCADVQDRDDSREGGKNAQDRESGDPTSERGSLLHVPPSRSIQGFVLKLPKDHLRSRKTQDSTGWWSTDWWPND
jgi:hypothetical protein